MAEKKTEVKSSSKKMLVKNSKGAPAATAPETTEAAAKTAKQVITKVSNKSKQADLPKVEVTSEVASADDLIVQIAKEVETTTEGKAFAAVERLQNSIEQDYFRLGGYLSRIQQENWQMEKGYETFKAYVESETGIQYRRAMYFISIYDSLVESGVPYEKVKSLGWTKLKEIARHLTQENVDEWVAVAENMTVLQLIEHVKSVTAGIGGAEGSPAEGADEAKKTSTKTFKLHADQRETVDAALAKAKHEGNTEHDSVALEYICLEFMTGTSKVKKMKTIKELMSEKSAEEVLGVFAEVFPKVELKATIEEEAEA